eukprot:5498466-Alexandrium_andersonii.AAC.1
MEVHFMCKVASRLGEGPEDLRVAKLLNRSTCWAEDGLRCEADPRRAEQLLTDLSAPLGGAKQVSSA